MPNSTPRGFERRPRWVTITISRDVLTPGQGFGTDERALIDTLSPLDAFKMDLVSRTFEQTTGKTLKHVLEKELSGWYVRPKHLRLGSG